MAKFINPFKAQKSVFGKLELIADIASLSKAGRMKYDEHIKQYRDTLVVMSTQRTEGKAEGLAEEKIEVVSKIVCAADSFFVSSKGAASHRNLSFSVRYGHCILYSYRMSPTCVKQITEYKYTSSSRMKYFSATFPHFIDYHSL